METVPFDKPPNPSFARLSRVNGIMISFQSLHEHLGLRSLSTTIQAFNANENPLTAHLFPSFGFER
jgi:hypothetical protein